MIPQLTESTAPERLGDLLLAEGLVTEHALVQALVHARATGSRLGSTLVELGHLRTDDAAVILARQHRVFACREADLTSVQPWVAALVPAALAHRLCALPIRIAGGATLVVAMRDPSSVRDLAELGAATGYLIRPLAASEARLRLALDRTYGASLEEATPTPLPPRRPTMTMAAVRPRTTSVFPAPTGTAIVDARPSGGRTLLVAALTTAVAVATYSGVRWLNDDLGGERAPATLSSPSLGLRAHIGAGWRRRSQPVLQLPEVAGAMPTEDLVRGDPTRPEAVLVLGHHQGGGRSIDDWAAWFEDGNLPVRGGTAAIDCEPSDAGRPEGGVCYGAAALANTDYDITAWFWPTANDGLIVAVWETRRGADVDREEGLAIANSIELL